MANLLLANLTFLVLRDQRDSCLLPLVLWGPVALLQGGVTLSVGQLTPGGDAAFMAAWACRRRGWR